MTSDPAAKENKDVKDVKEDKASSNVKTALRVIEIMEIFAREGRSLTLTELARLLGAPMSSCLGLVRTLAAMGYLHETGRRQGYYPTSRLLSMAQRIARNDPLLERVQPVMEALRDETGETVIFGKLQDDGRVIYLEVFESTNAIRYAASPGEVRQAHTNSIGRAILGAMPIERRDAILERAEFTRLTPRTLPSRKALVDELDAAQRRGWSHNFGESLTDLGAIAMPVVIGGVVYGISVAGPIARVESNQADIVEALLGKSALLGR